MTKHFRLYFSELAAGWRWLWRKYLAYWRGGWWHKTLAMIVILGALIIAGMYGVARWYAWTQRNVPLTYGVSFIPDYAESLGLNPEQTMSALINDLGVKNFRLTSYWSDMEPQKGHYDFSQLDWEFKKAESAHAKITLSIGLRQPRWPECHAPNWVDTSQPEKMWQPQLEAFMKKVIERYKNSPSLDSYQLENEYFNNFGQCQNHSRQRLVDEFNLVKSLDTKHPIIISRSNNFPNLPTGQPQPDIVGMSVYRRVWDNTLTHRYFTYPLPSWYYGFLAGAEKIVAGKNSVIHELQAEPWPPSGKTIQQLSLKEQNKTMSPARLESAFDYGRATGMRTMYLWGGEYWYYRMVKLHDPSLWNVARQEFQQS